MPHKTHIFASGESAFLVNSFLLEGAESVVIIDAQFLVSSAKALREKLDGIGKPLAALIVTHPHPDHYNGAAVLLEGRQDVPVLATVATDEGIRATAEAKRQFWTPQYGADYPQTFVYPNRIVATGETIAFGDISLTFDDIGPGEASNIVLLHSAASYELFASDLVYSACHPWLAEERSDLWLAQLDSAKSRYADVRTVHAGHGPSGTLSLLEAQIDYIESFRAVIGDHSARGELTDEAKARIREEMNRRYSAYPLEFLVDFNISAMAKELGFGKSSASDR
jgi:glyoxylase-like metal-dependent hydrolase (beta-lactamase superfamily II)